MRAPLLGSGFMTLEDAIGQLKVGGLRHDPPAAMHKGLVGMGPTLKGCAQVAWRDHTTPTSYRWRAQQQDRRACPKAFKGSPAQFRSASLQRRAGRKIWPLAPIRGAPPLAPLLRSQEFSRVESL